MLRIVSARERDHRRLAADSGHAAVRTASRLALLSTLGLALCLRIAGAHGQCLVEFALGPVLPRDPRERGGAAASGVKVVQFRILAFAITAGFAGLAGGFYGHYIGILTPDIGSVDQMGLVVAMAVIGGRKAAATNDRRLVAGIPGRSVAQLRPMAARPVRRMCCC